jgi:hypothetical protein
MYDKHMLYSRTRLVLFIEDKKRVKQKWTLTISLLQQLTCAPNKVR